MSVMVLNFLNSYVLSPGVFPAAVMCIYETFLCCCLAMKYDVKSTCQSVDVGVDLD